MGYGNKKKWGLPWHLPTRRPLVGFLPRTSILHQKSDLWSWFFEIFKKWDFFIWWIDHRGLKNHKKCNNSMVVYFKNTDLLSIKISWNLTNYDKMKNIWWKKIGWDHYPKWIFYGRVNFKISFFASIKIKFTFVIVLFL